MWLSEVSAAFLSVSSNRESLTCYSRVKMMVYILIKVSFEESFGFYKNGSTS